MTEPEDNSDRSKHRASTLSRIIVASLSWTVFLAVLAFSIAQWSHWFSPEGPGGVFYPSNCSNKLKQLGLAFHNYHDLYGSLPPAYTANDQGEHLQSWRTLILPFIQETRYPQYNFDEPWNSPHNKSVLEAVQIFRCNWDSESRFITDFFAVVGPDTAWPEHGSSTFKDLKDGTSQTILLIQIPDTDIVWSEPVDVHFDGTKLTLRGMPIEWPRQSRLRRTDWFWQTNINESLVLYADGSVGRIRSEASFDQLIPAITSNNSDSFDRSMLKQPSLRSYSAAGVTLHFLPFLLGCLFVTAWSISFQRVDRLIILLLFQFVGMAFAGSSDGRFIERHDYGELIDSIQGALFAIVIGFLVFELFYIYSNYRQKHRSR